MWQFPYSEFELGLTINAEPRVILEFIQYASAIAGNLLS